MTKLNRKLKRAEEQIKSPKIHQVENLELANNQLHCIIKEKICQIDHLKEALEFSQTKIDDLRKEISILETPTESTFQIEEEKH